MRKDSFLSGTYDFVFGIGAACSCTQTLRDAGLQFRSYPFDWLYGSDALSRLDMLASRFSGFIDKEDLRFAGQRKTPLPCDIYANERNHLVFNHDFPLDVRLEESYPFVREKYNRRIARLCHSLDKCGSVLMVYIETPNAKKRRTTRIIEQLKLGMDRVKKEWPNAKVSLVYLRNRLGFMGRLRWSIKTRMISNDIQIVDLWYKHPDGGVPAYVPNLKKLVALFRNVKLDKDKEIIDA